MNKVASILFFALLILLSSSTIASDEIILKNCHGCSEAQMKNAASAVAKPNGFRTVHIVDAINNVVRVYNVINISETEFQSTQVYATDNVAPEVLQAVDKVYELTNPNLPMNLSPADEIVIDKFKDMYPGLLPSHFRIINVPYNVIPSATQVHELHNHGISSSYIDKQVNIGPMLAGAKVLLAFISTNLKSWALNIYSDGSISFHGLDLPVATPRWGLKFSIDKDGNIFDANGKQITAEQAIIEMLKRPEDNTSGSGASSSSGGSSEPTGWVISGLGGYSGCFGNCEIPAGSVTITDLETK